MLKLISYDFRRSRDRILAVLVIMILFQIGVWLSSGTTIEETVSIHLIVYFVVGTIFLFFAAFSYNRNLKSYPRRLIPVNAIYTVLSPLLLYWLLLLSLLLIGLIHLGLYVLVYSADFLPANFWPVVIRSTLQCTWSAGLILLMVMFACTVARSIPLKGKVWITLAVLFAIENGVAYLEKLLFNNYFIGLDNAFRFEITKASDLSSGLELVYTGSDLIGVLVFEAGVAVLLVYAMTLLIRTRTEI
ncbi:MULTISPECIES: hypothetical protein [unclassified Paenibacillus]|uniref:hypothetical protein n=1 Tax=unclassified Paenibacillus TaxID=185978 RepID=UPI00240519A1|nr:MULTISPECIES: hypothetical protein [unclassified Paenibacillus]MDF9839080.1 hypothetical protein [Paenibacillus sp. PastF-2]MDF9845662.1 hypothetical protein [Paenibacillus sp. PastM-2]MDF9852234.1 hypothetical protein [Paenibacillus sp. PastF-1]MDH6478037.1 hypothetical protein [Paenibacillus sp. PastH-2]MDH6505772.1 hypothetical protein [Paenibacillus sp. PastM-3]